MDKIDEIAQRVQALSDDELVAFRRWFAEFDGEAWDRQFESDAKAGKSNSLAERARHR